MKIRDSTTGDQLISLEPNGGAVFAIAFDPSGNWLAIGCEDGKVRICDGRPIADE